MKQDHIALLIVAIVVLTASLIAARDRGEGPAQEVRKLIPVLSVAVTSAQVSLLPVHVSATGNIAAWQEASVGAEADGLRLSDINVDVGDTVRRGQVLALFNADIVTAELAEARASVAQAEAHVEEAETNARRARGLDGSGALSAQQIDQYVVAAKTARARLVAMRAVEKRNRLRVAQARVLAPCDGIVTSRAATVGAVVPAGQELFRLIRDGRLEWRAAVTLPDMNLLAPGQSAEIFVKGHPPIQGRLRTVAPAIDAQTRNGLVHVDLPRGIAIRAGAFARGYFAVSEGPALTVPQSAVLLRDGFHYVMRVGPASNVLVKKVSVGRRTGDRIEITAGLAESEAVIASGLGFLSEGDVVRVVSESEAAPNPARAHGVSES
jgi:RND family efflux transporter MFP subunit